MRLASDGAFNVQQPPPQLALAQVIKDLRAELLEALQEGADKELRFRLKPIEFEVSLGVTRATDGKGGVKFWVLEFGGGGKLEDVTTHKLKLVLEPIGHDGREFRLSDTAAERPAESGVNRPRG